MPARNRFGIPWYHFVVQLILSIQILQVTNSRITTIVNPWCMHEGCSIVILCVFVCIHVHWKQGAVRLFMAFQDMHCVVDFIENARVKISGNICWPPLPSLLLDEFLMNKWDSDDFFSRRIVCIGLAIGFDCNSTDTSLHDHSKLSAVLLALK